MKAYYTEKTRPAQFPEITNEFLETRIAESKETIARAIKESPNPLIIQFSGGRDSLAMVGLVRELTDRFICGYMVSGIEFPEAVTFASEMAFKLELSLMLSYPNDYHGDFFQRLNDFGTWPTVRATWCQRDLKVRPQAKRFHKLFGKPLYKLVGVRKWESNRRKSLYSLDKPMKPDSDVAGDFLVYPILNWTDEDVTSYLRSKGLPSSSLYKKYGVSGCYWCPFYQPNIYRQILASEPNRLDPFIAAEETYGPSVSGYIYLRDLRNEVLALI